MTREEAARILDPETSAEVLREYGDGNAQIAACDEACRIAAEVLRNLQPTCNQITTDCNHYPPAHIDREAWEPCEVCGEKDPFGNPKFSHHFVVDESSLYFCDSDFGWEGEKIKFCPFCSRPLTEEAWAELEKRLNG